MRAPAFWWRRPSLLSRLLAPIGWVYGAITLRRMRRPGADCGVPVICVGNFVAGGAGKTPTAIALTDILTQRGETPFVLMRGYGGSLPGPVEVHPEHHAAHAVGDEPLLMARHARTVIARDRVAGASLARALGASVIVMDDGLQNPALVKRLRLAVVDGASGVGNGLCLPAGPLRAPLEGQLGEVDAVLVIGAGGPGAAVAAAAAARGIATLGARLAPDPAVVARLADQPVLAVSGIGRPEKFAATLREAGARIVAERAYGDHHAYRRDDVRAVVAEAALYDSLIATTEKDWVKLAPLWPDEERGRLLPVPVRLVFDAPERIEALLAGAAGSTPAGAT
ncbi:tetraacyldisaccharide 4'-kinase [Bosea sp. (in: a-proteobacteria)]|uniref:tetraacyldisaccharide 4'-kinase n=1 Tax=Bosea sp. (in: a-proteobacteria) TaxID=1871050 RepID=UPI0027368A69|nr:tetraacyldisaccharide 4'-kinase [Bosea sp. (in: a-proteobacteria)]MDP3256380.1 tetraacyldisaccharide 4'-kinase [Bosea sp. (in: a-proteobacteria)]